MIWTASARYNLILLFLIATPNLCRGDVGLGCRALWGLAFSRGFKVSFLICRVSDWGRGKGLMGPISLIFPQ